MPHSPPRPPTHTAIPGRPTGRSLAVAPPSPYYFATPTRRNHFPAFSQKRPPSARTFDFSIPEARLLLTQVPRVARPRNSSPFPRRSSPPRILEKWGLTNGLAVLMIDCMHGANHTVSHYMHPGSASVRRGSRGTGETRVAGGGLVHALGRSSGTGMTFAAGGRTGTRDSRRDERPAGGFGGREGGVRWPGSKARGWERTDRSAAVIECRGAVVFFADTNESP